MSYFRSINQAVTVSSGNSDSSNLPVNGIFTGTGVSTLGVNAIQVNLKSDQNCNVFIDQGPDNSNWYINDQFNYYNDLGGNSWTTQATDAYARVRVKNVGTSSTTTKVLSTVLCPIVEALPRALSTEGNLKVGVYEIEGDFDTRVLVTPMSELKTTTSYRLAGVAISGSTVDTNFWQSTATGSGNVTQSNGEMVIADGTTASSSIRVQSIRRARYLPGMCNYYRGQVRCPTQAGACTRRWGAYDTTDGYFYQYDGTNVSLMSRKSSVDTTTSNGSFNGTYGVAYSMDNTNRTYEIYWTNSNAYFYISNVLLHTLSAPTLPLVSTPHLLIGMECVNGTGNTANNNIMVRSATINRLGAAETAPMYAYATTSSASAVVLKYGPGRLHKVVINSLGTGANTLTLYDNTAIANPFAIFSTSATSSFGSIDYHLDFFTGLSYVLNGGTGAANVTIVYE